MYQKMPELKIERDVVRICVYVFPLRPFFFPRPQPRCGLQVGLLSNTLTDGTMNQKDLQRRVMLPNEIGKKIAAPAGIEPRTTREQRLLVFRTAKLVALLNS